MFPEERLTEPERLGDLEDDVWLELETLDGDFKKLSG